MHPNTRHLLDLIEAAAKRQEPYMSEVHDLARELASELEGPELAVALRKLLEAGDAIARASPIATPPEIAEPRAHVATRTAETDHAIAFKLALAAQGEVAIVGSITLLQLLALGRDPVRFVRGVLTTPNGRVHMVPGDSPDRLRGRQFGTVILVPGAVTDSRMVDAARMTLREPGGTLYRVDAGQVKSTWVRIAG